MAEADADSKLKARLTELDASYPSPDERARVVWEILRSKAPDLTDWDVVCFAANYLGWQSQNFTWLEDDAKKLCRMVYTAHYLATNQDITTELKRNGRGPHPAEHQHPRTQPPAEPPRKQFGFDVSGGGFG